MKYITYQQNGRGRSGHQLKDIITVFIISFLTDKLNVIYNNSWENQKIFENINVKNINYNQSSEIVTISNLNDNKYINKCRFDGITFDTLSEILNQINNCKENTIINFTDVIRIHPYQLHNWFIEKKINKDFFTMDLIPLLRKLYNKNISELNNVFAIHIRRGDLAKKMISEGWDINLYKNIILLINKFFDIPINIYSENINSKDLLKLKGYKNVNLKMGNTDSLKKDLHEMITSKYLLISNSSLSNWMAYISKGDIFMPKNLVIRHFQHIKYPSNFHYIDDLENYINEVRR